MLSTGIRGPGVLVSGQVYHENADCTLNGLVYE